MRKRVFLFVLAAMAMLAVLPLLGMPEWAWRLVLWTIAAISVAVGFAAVELRKTVRRKFGKLDDRIANQCSAQLRNHWDRLARMEGRILKLENHYSAQLRSHSNQLSQMEERIPKLEGHILGLEGSVPKLIEGSIPKLNDIDQFKELADKIAGREADIQTLKDRSFSLDLLSVLRSMGLRQSIHGASSSKENDNPSSDHGHALLMAVLSDEERAKPGSLANAVLVEIGTTRERIAGQGSTEKLAIFATLTEMQFVTVDIDPKNSKRAQQSMRYLNSAAKAVTARGENYLSLFSGALDFVYLDAFDFDHGKHSQQRQDRYRELLQTDINDEACWKMHEACARAIKAKMRVGGIVVIDDTWTGVDGTYAGKGKLAVPLLLDSGFEIIAKTRMTVALRRTEIKKDVNAMESESASPNA
jgi:hypothetical protein